MCPIVFSLFNLKWVPNLKKEKWKTTKNDFVCVREALRCNEYEDVLGYKVFVIIALACLEAENYYECSRAFTKLETHPDISLEKQKRYKKLAAKIFISK